MIPKKPKAPARKPKPDGLRNVSYTVATRRRRRKGGKEETRRFPGRVEKA